MTTRPDIGVFRPSTGVWYRQPSTGAATAASFGVTGDAPVLGDYDGDGKADLGVFPPLQRPLDSRQATV